MQPAYYMTNPETPHPGPGQYLARVSNLWLLRYHLPLLEGVADLYGALCFLWHQQGYPTPGPTASLEELVDVTRASKTIVRARLEQLLELGLLAGKSEPKRGQATCYSLGPDPAELQATKFPQEPCRWQPIRYQNLIPNSNGYQNLIPNGANNGYQNLIPNSNGYQILIPNPTPKIIQMPGPEVDTIGYQILSVKPLEEEDIRGDLDFSLNKKTDETPTPLPPAPVEPTPAQEYEARKKKNQAAAVAFEQFLALYEGRNTANKAAWQAWQKLSQGDWDTILKLLPSYCLWTSGDRLKYRKANDKFLTSDLWKSPDGLAQIKQQYEKTLTPTPTNGSHTTKGNRNYTTGITRGQRQNAPEVSDFGDLNS